MTDYVTPCASSENDPDDWFIEKDGKQYPEDDLITEALRTEIREAVVATVGIDDPDLFERIDDAIELAEAEALKAALTRRRHAKDACHVDCLLRTQCLQIALTDPEPTHGTWGGYYREELREIRRLRDERQKARESQQTDTADEE